jgi:formamidopyrimidine-DNA glycosylase
MPELPEVETVARQLAPHVTGRTVLGLRLFDPRLRGGRTPRLAGRRIVSVTRAGKRVLFELSPRPGGRDALWLAVHLRMTGRLLWSDNGRPPLAAHVRARLRLTGGDVWFDDARRFGTFDWHAAASDVVPRGAVDPLSRALTPRRLGALAAGSRQGLKAWLLRQDRLVGLGNIYASEILHAAGLSPFREAGSLDAGERGRLVREMRRILRRAIRASGTTISDYQDARGGEGSFQNFLRVYDRAAEPCRRCGAPIVRTVQQQRSTYHCPRCQR